MFLTIVVEGDGGIAGFYIIYRRMFGEDEFGPSYTEGTRRSPNSNDYSEVGWSYTEGIRRSPKSNHYSETRPFYAEEIRWFLKDNHSYQIYTIIYIV